MSEELDDQKLAEAIDRIARSEDGHALYRYCQKRLSSITMSSAEPMALARNEGAREFAASLMGLMAEGIAESGRGDTIVFRTGRRHADEPTRQFKPRPGGRRIDSNVYVAGWDGPEDEPAA